MEVDDLGPGAARRLAVDRDTLALAPVMPMRLVAPVDRRGGEAVGDVAWGVAAVGAPDSPFTGAGVTVAVLDTGIDPKHEAFSDDLEIVQRNFTDGSDHDEDGHGTHCAGIIFGGDVDSMRIGVAPGVRRALIAKVLGSEGGGSDRIADAILWAVAQGAQVVSMSLGIDFPSFGRELVAGGMPTELAISMALEAYRATLRLFDRLAALVAARAEFGAPAVLIAAAGNASRRETDPEFVVGVEPPGAATGVVSVAALDRGADGYEVPGFSNVGATLAAPGVQIASAGLGGGIRGASGTSSAAPHVAGVAALWAQHLRETDSLSLRLLTDRLVGQARTDRLAPSADAHSVGAGLVRAPPG